MFMIDLFLYLLFVIPFFCIYGVQSDLALGFMRFGSI